MRFGVSAVQENILSLSICGLSLGYSQYFDGHESQQKLVFFSLTVLPCYSRLPYLLSFDLTYLPQITNAAV